MIFSFFFFFYTVVLASLQHKEAHKNLPIVLWHGLGDSYDSKDIVGISRVLSESLNTFVYSIYLDKDSLNDRNSGFFGKVDDQIEYVFKELSDIPELKDGFNAIGFSQGGLFLRGYIERYNMPRVYNLITFGAPHNGISDIYCPFNIFSCKAISYLIKHNLWSSWIKDNIVVSQYYRDPDKIDDYIEHCPFLCDINNERDVKNETYAKNLASLSCLVMVEFSDDELIIPKESSHFNDFNKITNEVIYLRDRPIYIEDWIGLKQLDEKNALIEITIPGNHMEMDYTTIVYIAKKYFGGTVEYGNTIQWQSEDQYQRS